MKIRSGFVSNSSSSSFIVRKAYLSEEEIEKIKDHAEIANGWPWRILEYGSVLVGYTSMDNFDMKEYIEGVVKIPYALCWIERPGWAWTSLFKELGGRKDIIQFTDDPENTENKPPRHAGNEISIRNGHAKQPDDSDRQRQIQGSAIQELQPSFQ